MPVNYLCLDINPSVELGINVFGRVVSTQAYNEDGLRLLGNNDYSNLSAEDAVSTLVQDAAKQGFIAGDGSTVIAVTAESNKENAAVELLRSGESGANLTLSAGGISAIMYSDYTDLQLRKQAQDLGISPGKLRLILILQTLDSSITIEDYQNAKITDIITKANELLTQPDSNWKKGTDAERLEKIHNAAQLVQTAYANAEPEQKRSSPQIQNQGSGGQKQNQEQIQGSNDSGAQYQVQNQGLETNQQIQSQSSDTGQQQTQAQNSSIGQQQTQAPEEQPQNQLQGGGAPVSNPNKGQTADPQSGNRETVQDDTGSVQIAPAETSGNESSSGAQSGNRKGGR